MGHRSNRREDPSEHRLGDLTCRRETGRPVPDASGQVSVQVRTPSERTIRKAEQIHHQELAAAMLLLLAEMGSATGDQLIVSAARLFGWNRTGSNIQDRLEPIIQALVNSGHVKSANGFLSPAEDRS